MLDVIDPAVQLASQVPNPSSDQPPGFEGVTDILGWIKWGALAVCVAGLMIGGAMLAIGSRRGEGSEHAGRIGMVLVAVIIISAAASLVGFLAS